MTLDPLFYLILGHYFGDFALQTDRMAKDKQHSKSTLTLHVFIYTVTVAVFLFLGLTINGDWEQHFNLLTLGVFAIVLVEHWIQDKIKGSRFNGSKQGFYLDQGFHLVMLYIVRIVLF